MVLNNKKFTQSYGLTVAHDATTSASKIGATKQIIIIIIIIPIERSDNILQNIVLYNLIINYSKNKYLQVPVPKKIILSIHFNEPI